MKIIKARYESQTRISVFLSDNVTMDALADMFDNLRVVDVSEIDWWEIHPEQLTADDIYRLDPDELADYLAEKSVNVV